MAADGQRYAGPDASTCAARASACVSTYSRMLVSLPFRTVMAKIHLSRVRIHNQNITTAANAHADKKTLGHLS